MGGTQQPFLLRGEVFDDARFPIAVFDPKAVTRASYEAKPRKPKPEGPLVSFNMHPDAHMVLEHPSLSYMPMGRRTKVWIKRVRGIQLVFRILELIAAAGLLVLTILITSISDLSGWVMRITPGVMLLHCSYAIYHLSRSAGRRTPGSSAAYHTFAGILDFTVLPLYAYGALCITNDGDDWGTLLSHIAASQLLPAIYYTLIGAGSVHVVSLTASLWLGIVFRRIAMMPPGMNPLEDHLTSRTRQHKRNKSSVATTISSSATAADPDDEKRLSSRLGELQHPSGPSGLLGMTYYDEDLSRPPSIPFMHTRRGSTNSQQSASGSAPSHPGRRDIAHRQYQVMPGSKHDSPSSSSRSSLASISVAASELKRINAASTSSPSPTPPPHHHHYPVRASCTDMPLRETGYVAPVASVTATAIRPGSGLGHIGGYPSGGTVATYRASQVDLSPQAQVEPRVARFSDSWDESSDSLIGSQTLLQQRGNRASGMLQSSASGHGGSVGVVAEKRRAYEALSQRYDGPDAEGSDVDGDVYADDNEDYRYGGGLKNDYDYGEKGEEEQDLGVRNLRPNPLRSNPVRGGNNGPLNAASSNGTGPTAFFKRPKTPYSFDEASRRPPVLSEISTNDQRVSSGMCDDLANVTKPSKACSSPSFSDERKPRNRNGSIQPETDFCSKPYGGLEPRPVAVGKNDSGGGRVLSSGNDWDFGDDLGGRGNGRFGRRNVSGKVAEEGLADWSRY